MIAASHDIAKRHDALVVDAFDGTRIIPVEASASCRLAISCEAAIILDDANFELHIEQGPILPENNRSIGVVRGAQSYRWLNMTEVSS
jgi:hypothetical protein